MFSGTVKYKVLVFVSCCKMKLNPLLALLLWLVYVAILVCAQESSLGKCWFPTAREDTLCANLSVPLNWFDRKDSRRIFVTTSYLPPPDNQALLGVIWFLNGGGGVATRCIGSTDDPLARLYNDLGFGVAYPDFRGAGESTPRLDCKDDPDAVDIPSVDCGTALAETFGSEGMRNYGLTAAATDLKFMMDTLFSENTVHFIQADSFGTFWAQRFALTFPQRATRIVAESFDSPTAYEFFNALTNLDWVGRRVLSKCSVDVECSKRASFSGLDITWLWRQVLSAASKGTLPCIRSLPSEMAPNGDWYAALVKLLGAFLGPDRSTYPFIPATITRLIRCNSDDVAALQFLWRQQQQGEARFLKRRSFGARAVEQDGRNACTISQVVLYNVFFEAGVRCVLPTEDQLQMQIQREQPMFSGPPELLVKARQLYDVWPLFDDARGERGRFPPAVQDMLYVNGDLDISTPLANAFSVARLTNHPLVVLPNAPHVAYLFSPVPFSAIPCGVSVIASYFASGAPNTSCIPRIIPLDFALNSAVSRNLSRSFFGTQHAWGGTNSSECISFLLDSTDSTLDTVSSSAIEHCTPCSFDCSSVSAASSVRPSLWWS